jgi:hypothetical protein
VGALEDAETELCGDGSAYVARATRWRWGGPRAGEIVGSLTLQRSGPDGDVWELHCSVTIDPDDHGRPHVDLVVRWTSEVRLANGLPGLGQWWTEAALLRPVEREAIAAVALDAADSPPSRFAPPDGVDRLPLRLDAGSLGSLEGELLIDADLGLAYVRATRADMVEAGLAARTLRTAVDDGRLAVPHFIRAWLENGGALLALEGPGEL